MEKQKWWMQSSCLLQSCISMLKYVINFFFCVCRLSVSVPFVLLSCLYLFTVVDVETSFLTRKSFCFLQDEVHYAVNLGVYILELYLFGLLMKKPGLLFLQNSPLKSRELLRHTRRRNLALKILIGNSKVWCNNGCKTCIFEFLLKVCSCRTFPLSAW